MSKVWIGAVASLGFSFAAFACSSRTDQTEGQGHGGDAASGGSAASGGDTASGGSAGSGGNAGRPGSGNSQAGDTGGTGTNGDAGTTDGATDAAVSNSDGGGERIPCTAGGSGKPNIVTIMVDDLDQASFDVLVANGKLPNVQENLLGRGMQFTESYVANSLCCPSRATFLTGQYSHNCNVLSNADGFGQFTPHENDTIGTHMKAAGYRTAYLGKYLNGYTSSTYHAPGWDEWQALQEPGVYYMWGFTLIKSIDDAAATQVTYEGACGGGQPCTGESATNYQTDVLADLGATFIDDTMKAGKQPFFLVIMPLAPHAEVLPDQDFDTFSLMRQLRVRPAMRHLGVLRAKLSDGSIDLFNPVSAAFDIPNMTMPSFNEADVSDKPSWLRDGPTGAGGWPLLSAQEIQYQRRQHLDRLESMLAIDDMVGTLYDTLDAQGIRDETVVILTSDNGFSLGSHRLNNKMFPYEEDIRVPLVASCNASGQGTNDHLVSNIDLAATITDYARKPWEQDGRSFRALLEGEAVASWRTRLLVEHWYNPTGPKFNDLPDHALVRTAKDDANPSHKLVGYYGLSGTLQQTATPAELEQYDLAGDPWELENVASDPGQQATRDALAPKLQALRACSGASCRAADRD